MKLLLSTLACLLILSGCTTALSEGRIKEMLEKANHCESVDDCALIGSKCPFDCYIYVHTDEAERMKAIVDGFSSTCTYSCAASAGVVCERGKCVTVTHTEVAE